MMELSTLRNQRTKKLSGLLLIGCRVRQPHKETSPMERRVISVADLLNEQSTYVSIHAGFQQLISLLLCLFQARFDEKEYILTQNFDAQTTRDEVKKNLFGEYELLAMCHWFKIKFDEHADN